MLVKQKQQKGCKMVIWTFRFSHFCGVFCWYYM